MSLLPFAKLTSLMLEAYPCIHFCSQEIESIKNKSEVISESCSQAIWSPLEGKIPRGFLGATGNVDDVKVIMVFAEPGNPIENDNFDLSLDSNYLLETCINHTYNCMKNREKQFHKNVRWFLDELLPETNGNFDEQLRYVWLTESRLCSITKAGGSASRRNCTKHFLKRQIDMMSHARIIAFGGKAQGALDRLNKKYISAWAFAKPGANRPEAKQSWECAIKEYKLGGKKCHSRNY